MSRTSASPGEVMFQIDNEGTILHEFVLVRTDLGAAHLPLENGDVVEEGLEIVAEARDMAPGETTSVTADLTPGAYAIICNLSGHHQRGMRADFIVE